MQISFDIDGTLYDTLSTVLGINEHIFKRLGYVKLDPVLYVEVFQSKDWFKFYHDLGIKEEHIEEVLSSFYQHWDKVNPPKIISGAKECLTKIEDIVGMENLSFVSNGTPQKIEEMFCRDRIEKYLPLVKTSKSGKADILYELAKRNNTVPFYYIGDLVSDGEECLTAREIGADNIYFKGLVHPYSFSTPENMKKFTRRNLNFASTINNLEDFSSKAKKLKEFISNL